MSQPSLFQMTITLSQLESHHWEAANILRGSPVDRTDWKSYILRLLFVRPICDVWDKAQKPDNFPCGLCRTGTPDPRADRVVKTPARADYQSRI